MSRVELWFYVMAYCALGILLLIAHLSERKAMRGDK